MPAREEVFGSTLVRADGCGATRLRDARGFVLLSVQVKRLVIRGEKTGEWAQPKRPWRVTPPRGWDFASVAIADWSLRTTGRAKGALDHLGLSAALELAKDGKLDAWVQGICRGPAPPMAWRGAVNVQVSIFGRIPGPATSPLAIPPTDLRAPRRSRVPRAAGGAQAR